MSTTPLELAVLGLGLVGPGLPSWTAARPVLRGEAPYAPTPTTLAPPSRLPPAERRRAGPSIRLAMAVADEAVTAAGLDPRTLATVFAASSGEGSNCDALCEMLASPGRLVSPTRFTNSVHNATAGYWHIAVGSQAPSTSLSAYDRSFAAGLLEAAVQAWTGAAPVLLVAADVPYPEPLHRLRPLPHPVGAALLLAPAARRSRVAGPPRLVLESLAIEDDAAPAATPCRDSVLETLRRSVPAAAALPLFEAVARAQRRSVVLESGPGSRLRVDIDAEGS
jgi:hypothetical protein